MSKESVYTKTLEEAIELLKIVLISQKLDAEEQTKLVQYILKDRQHDNLIVNWLDFFYKKEKVLFIINNLDRIISGELKPKNNEDENEFNKERKNRLPKNLGRKNTPKIDEGQSKRRRTVR